MIEFSVEHSEDSVRSVYQAYWKLKYQGMLRIAFLLLTLLFVPVILYRGDVHWLVYCLITAITLFAVLLQSVRDSARRMALEQFRLIDPPSFQYRLTETGIWEKSAICRCELAWSAFAGTLRLPGYLLIVRAPADAGQFIALPEGQLPPEAEAFLNSRLQPL